MSADRPEPRALILAAGLSTRMRPAGDLPKAALELEGKSLLQRAVEALRGGGVQDVRVVTGHKAWAVEKEAGNLGLACVRNLEYRQGMFSSVRAGLCSLFHEEEGRGREEAMGRDEAFFLLPVDAALLWRGSVAAMVRAWRGLSPERRGTACIIPAFAGRCGHPPLIGAAFGRELLEQADQWAENGGARGYLAALLPAAQRGPMLRGCAPEARLPEKPGRKGPGQAPGPFALRRATDSPEGRDVYVLPLPDQGLLSDIDQPSELAEAAQFLRLTRQRESLTPQEAWEWLRHGDLGAEKIRHCIKVGLGALRLGLALRNREHETDPVLHLCAGLLHDIGRAHQQHTELARRWIEDWGRPECALAAGAHTMLPAPLLARLGVDLRDDPGARDKPGFTAADYEDARPALVLASACVYLADKLFHGGTQVSVARRFARVRKRFAGDPDALRVLARREEIALAVARRLADDMGGEPDKVVATNSGHALEEFCAGMLDEFSA